MLSLVNILSAVFMKRSARCNAKKCFKDLSNNKEAETEKKYFPVL